jgi:hypothetical protein
VKNHYFLGMDKENEMCEMSSNSAKKKYKPKVLKFYDSFLRYGIHEKTDNGEKKPYCLLCNQAFSKSSLKHSNLKRHQVCCVFYLFEIIRYNLPI